MGFKILCDFLPWEERAIILKDNEPFDILTRYPLEKSTKARLHEIYEVILTNYQKGEPFGYARLSSEEDVFFEVKGRTDLHEGLKLHGRIITEAQNGKPAKIRLLKKNEARKERHFSCLKNEIEYLYEEAAKFDLDARSEIDETLSELSQHVFNLQASKAIHGKLICEPTEALLSIDIDGRKLSQKGDSDKAASALNKVALSAIFKRLKLGHIGGLIAIDLARHRKKYDTALLDHIKMLSKEDAHITKTELVSSLGILLLARRRQRHPLFWVKSPKPSPLYDMLRTIDSAAKKHRENKITCHLSDEFTPLWQESGLDWQGYFARNYGHRFEFIVSHEIRNLNIEIK